MRLCAVSVDLDEIPNYFAIHGLREPTGPERSLVYDLALDRLTDLAQAARIPLTLFVVGADLVRAEAAAKVRAAHERGFEVANHTLDHRYDLVRLGHGEIARQIGEGARVIEDVTGVRPAGFRAPGYTMNDDVFGILADLGVTYDSSVFPCPVYWAAKAAAIGVIRARGRASRSILDTPAVLAAPTRPYRVGRPYWQRGAGIVELPIQVTPGIRLPFIGTFLTQWGPRVARALARRVRGEPLVNLELHGIDVLDAFDGLQALRYHQRDVRVPWAQKVESLAAVLAELKAADYAFTTMTEAAAQPNLD